MPRTRRPQHIRCERKSCNDEVRKKHEKHVRRKFVGGILREREHEREKPEDAADNDPGGTAEESERPIRRRFLRRNVVSAIRAG